MKAFFKKGKGWESANDRSQKRISTQLPTVYSIRKLSTGENVMDSHLLLTCEGALSLQPEISIEVPVERMWL